MCKCQAILFERNENLSDIYRVTNIESTQRELIDSISGSGKTGLPKSCEWPRFLSLVADMQTKGVGRGVGRSWISPKGHLYSSTAVRKNETFNLQGLPMALAMELLIELNKNKSGIIKIKWPNDLFVCGKFVNLKCGGIVVHVIDDFVVIGIGINSTYGDPLETSDVGTLNMPVDQISAAVQRTLLRIFGSTGKASAPNAVEAYRRARDALMRCGTENVSPLLYEGNHVEIWDTDALGNERPIGIDGLISGITANGALILRALGGDLLPPIYTGSLKLVTGRPMWMRK